MGIKSMFCTGVVSVVGCRELRLGHRVLRRWRNDSSLVYRIFCKPPVDDQRSTEERHGAIFWRHEMKTSVKLAITSMLFAVLVAARFPAMAQTKPGPNA